MVTSMVKHPGNAGVREQACGALYFMIAGNANDRIRIRARKAGAQKAAEDALRVHSGNERVNAEARDLLKRME